MVVVVVVFFGGTREEVEGRGGVDSVGFGTISVIYISIVKFEGGGGGVDLSVWGE